MEANRTYLEKKVTELAHKTKLKKQVVQNLVEHYFLKCKERGLDRDSVRDDLMHEFDLLDDFLLDRIYRTFDISASTPHLKLDDYVIGMATFLSSNLEDKIKFCFNVYDLNGDGYITRDKMLQFLKNCMVMKTHDADQDDAEESIREMIELALKQLDEDGDGRVSFSDFRRAVHNDSLLMESLGTCLPDEKSRCRFLKMLGDPDMNAQPVTFSSRNQARSAKRSRWSTQQVKK